jgi:hypothetical protein
MITLLRLKLRQAREGTHVKCLNPVDQHMLLQRIDHSSGEAAIESVGNILFAQQFDDA